ncbi:MAG: 30S ribosomal protein S8 [candidate division Zixibacteria bacterium]|nr:30S ribosomal protein S8 [candidate division Zixibacteria bacterium]MBU1471463.1 30S ribosomal protein S8 [candidate division Zixibacteria bacterium]MBU2625621.1 30S ribosomal protein S8 [candidate division Zixibacteria bacterium]
MSMTDPISDMLTRIRNAAKAQHKVVDIPSSGIKIEIARILHDLGFIREYSVAPDSKQGVLRVFLKYTKRDESVIMGLRRVSKPGLRKYVTIDDMKKLGYQVGTTIISTSRGIMTHDEALKAGVGGEAMLRVW